MTAAVIPTLFPPIEPNRTGTFALDDVHTMYWEESGNPQGVPALFLHGGPGGGASPLFRRFFDPAHYRIVLFDQRGSGKSTPNGETVRNTTPLLVQDIEVLRRFLGIEAWLLFGGSWGATLALAYAQAHPQRCLGLALRSIFLCTKPEVDWFFYGGQVFHPELHAQFVAPIPPQERGDLLAAYTRLLFDPDPAVHMPAARSWTHYETSRASMRPQTQNENPALDICLARLEAHYMANLGFFEGDQLIREMPRIAHVPTAIVQGRYDVLCPPVTAHRLHAAQPRAKLYMLEASGHTAFEPEMLPVLLALIEQFKRLGNFG